MKNRILHMLVLTAILGFSFAAGARGGKESAAVMASKRWLALVDAQQYNESWETAAEYFKDAIISGRWEKMLTAVRRPLGKVQSRELASKEFMTEIPGASDGEYVVIQYKTSFENKKSAFGTATPMLDKDGKWRVSGYFIK